MCPYICIFVIRDITAQHFHLTLNSASQPLNMSDEALAIEDDTHPSSLCVLALLYMAKRFLTQAHRACDFDFLNPLFDPASNAQPEFTQDQFVVRRTTVATQPYDADENRKDFDVAHQRRNHKTLHDFRTLYEDSVNRGLGSRQAVRMLQKVNEFNVNPETAPDNTYFANAMTDVSYTIPDHNLDYLFAFPKDEGLDVLLPPRSIERGHDWIFQMHLNKPLSKLRTKYGLVGFDPTEAVLSIGRQSLDHIWFAMCQKTELQLAGDAYPAGHQFGEQTSMATPHYRIVIVYLLQCLAHAGIGGIMVDDSMIYKIPLTHGSKITWSDFTRDTIQE